MNNWPHRHLISIADLDRAQVDWIVRRALLHSQRDTHSPALAGRVVGLYFSLTSTRTRTAFAVGAMKLGANSIIYGPRDLQINTGETLQDTVKVLATMLDALVMRTDDDSASLQALAGNQTDMAIINAMSLDEHPTQALADLATMCHIYGNIDNLSVLYIGEGNSTASALALALAKYSGTRLYLRTPAGFGLSPAVSAALRSTAAPDYLDERHDIEDLPPHVDVIYTTRWHTTGTQKPEKDWRTAFAPFRVTSSLLRKYPSSIFMHDLPAHRGEDVDAEVIDGPQSVVYQQAAYKLFAAMGTLEWCLTDNQTSAH
jgi:ornithine carbamoyltransferase